MFAKHDGMSVVGEAGASEEALGLVERLAPDVLIIDAGMPPLGESEIARHLRERRLATRILMLSAHDMDDRVIALLEAGAHGYMMKTATSSQLIDAVECVHRGERVLDSAIERRMGEKLWTRGRRTSDALEETLTRQERRVLQLATQGLTNKAIATELGISFRTVQAHFNNTYSKLNVSSRMQAVLYALAAGAAEAARVR